MVELPHTKYERNIHNKYLSSSKIQNTHNSHHLSCYPAIPAIVMFSALECLQLTMKLAKLNSEGHCLQFAKTVFIAFCFVSLLPFCFTFYLLFGDGTICTRKHAHMGALYSVVCHLCTYIQNFKMRRKC